MAKGQGRAVQCSGLRLACLALAIQLVAAGCLGSSASPSASTSLSALPSPLAKTSTAALPSATPTLSPTASPTPTATPKPVGKFIKTGSLLGDRVEGATSTVLANGWVLVTGGDDSLAPANVYMLYASAEIYNPATGLWSKTGSMAHGRSYHTATLLRSGKVLIVGGSDSKKAELYDPATGKFSLTGTMTSPASYHTATLLRDGRVLIAGGSDGGPYAGGSYLASAEIYDPGTGKFSPTGSMKVARENAQAVLLPSGKVLIVGGDLGMSSAGGWDSLESAEIYDPGTGKFTPTGSMNIPRTQFSATLLPTGKVLLAGDADTNGPEMAEIYDPATGKFTRLQSWDKSAAARLLFIQPVLLLDGRVLILGGNDAGDPPMLYDPATDAYSPIGSLPTGGGLLPVLLQNGSVLMPGAPSNLYVP